MTKVRIGERAFKIFFATEPTIKSGILGRVARTEGKKDWGIENVGELVETIAELLLVGLQKFHSDEFGFNYTTGDGKDVALSKVYDLLDDITTDEDESNTFMSLFSTLEDEMIENGFFKKLFREEKEKVEMENKATQEQEEKNSL